VTTQLLDLGIEATWNDNNEWRVEDEAATCNGFGTPTPLRLLRPVQALLMVRASLEAQRAHAPHLRPWLISRSGMPGTQRYAQTWRYAHLLGACWRAYAAARWRAYAAASWRAYAAVSAPRPQLAA
jgi:hypothetical protein